MKPGDLVRIKETPILTYQGYSNKIGIIVKTTKEHTSFDAIPVAEYQIMGVIHKKSQHIWKKSYDK